MDYFSQLPPELLQQILGHLSTSSTGSPGLGLDHVAPSSSLHSALPLSAPYLGLSFLATTSRHFHRHVAPLLHSLVCLDTSSRLTAFVDACTRPPKILRLATPRRIFLGLATGAGAGATPSTSKNVHVTPQKSKWPQDSIQQLFASPLVRELHELHVSGVKSTSTLLRVLEGWVPSSQGSDEASGQHTGLKTLVIKADHARRDIDGNGSVSIEGLDRDISNLTIESDSSDGDELDLKSSRIPSSPARKTVAQHPCSLLALLDRLSSSLENLTLSHFAFSASPPCRLGINFGRLRRLSLSYCDLSVSALAFLLEGSRVESLELVSCSGLTRDGAITIAQRHGQHLRSLRLETDTTFVDDLPRPSSTRTSSGAPASSPPPNSPRRHQQAEQRPLSPLHHVLDLILPHTPNLIHLAWSGPLASSDMDSSTLTPRLRTLSISQCPTWSTSLILHTLFSGPSRPSHLRKLVVDRPIPLSCSSGSEIDQARLDLQEVWGLARSKEVELGGSLFECLNERMRWADEVGLREATKGEDGMGMEDLESRRAGTERRRKRPSLC